MKKVLRLVTIATLVGATLLYTCNGIETKEGSGEVRDYDDLLEGYSVSDLLKKEIELVKTNKKEMELKQLRDKLKEEELERQRIKQREEKLAKLKLQQEEDEKRARKKSDVATSRGVDKGLFTATAYDLSIASCGKSESHPAYGITANGTSLKGHTLESARAIAVDPKVIKLGSKVYIEFLDEDYKHLDGEYVAVDTGGAIKGKIIDVFFGSGNVAEEVEQFGRRKVKIKVITE